MGKRRTIGIYFGPTTVAIAEVEGTALVNQYCGEYSVEAEKRHATSLVSIEDAKTTLLQKILNEKSVDTREAVIALPMGEAILRSFVVPKMPKSEMPAAVEFEARKYLPFKPEELAHDYQAFDMRDDKARKNRIVFVGVKNETLEGYTFALAQSELSVDAVEPSVMSLIRALMFHGKINKQETIAVVEVSADGGMISICDKGVPTFVNEFKFPGKETSQQQDTFLAQLTGAIRLSLDYYHRLAAPSAVNSLLLYIKDIPFEVVEALQKELGVPASILYPNEVLGLPDAIEIGLMYAYGAALRNSFDAGVTIDVSKKKSVSVEAAPASEKFTPWEIQTVVRSLIIAAVVVGSFYLFNQSQVSETKKRLQQFVNEQAKIEASIRSLPQKQLEAKLSETKKKIAEFSKLSKDTTLTSLLSVLPRLLPKGVWLESFNFGQDANGKSLTLRGICFSEDRSAHLVMINQFLAAVKQNESFSRSFKKIEVSSMNQREASGLTVTSFEIICR